MVSPAPPRPKGKVSPALSTLDYAISFLETGAKPSVSVESVTTTRQLEAGPSGSQSSAPGRPGGGSSSSRDGRDEEGRRWRGNGQAAVVFVPASTLLPAQIRVSGAGPARNLQPVTPSCALQRSHEASITSFYPSQLNQRHHGTVETGVAATS